MAALGLSEALTLAEAARLEGVAAVTITVVANRTEEALVPGQRVLLRGDGVTHGNLHPMLDELVIGRASRALQEKRSQSRSYSISGEAARDVGVAGGNVDLYFEVFPRPRTLVIVGAGHIAVPLSRMAALLEFQVIVIDDRPEYANVERFPEASSVLVGPYGETVAGLSIDDDTYIVLVTRGHVHDQACLELVLESPAPYIGMIGSKRRVRTVMEHVGKKALDSAGLNRLYAPVGIDIGAQTPAEIALAILAEITNIRRGGASPSLRLRGRAIDC